MRRFQVIVTGLCLLGFLFFAVSNSRVYTYVDDVNLPGQVKESELHHLRLSGLDFIAGNMPDELDGELDGPRYKLPGYRLGAIFCASALMALFLIGIFMNRLFRFAWFNIVSMIVYLASFIALEDFKNAYFEFASRLPSPNGGHIIESGISMIGLIVNAGVISIACVSIAFLFSRKLRNEHAKSVR